MSDHQNKDRLEEFFRKSLGDINAPASSEGWDVPSNDVWAGIAQNIQTKEPLPASDSNRKWWIAALLILLFLFAYQHCTYQNKITAFESQLEQTDQELQQLKEQLNQRTSIVPQASNENINPLNSAKDVQPTQEISLSEKSNTSKKLDENIAHSKTESSKKLKESNPRKTELSSEKEASIILQDSSTLKEVDLTEVVDKPAIAATKKEEIEQKSLLGKIEELSAEIAELKAALKEKEKSLYSIQDSIHLNPIVNSELPKSVEKSEPWSITTYFAPAYMNRTLQNKKNGNLKPYREREAPNLSYTAGLLAGYGLGSKNNWTIYSGLNFTNLSQASVHRFGLRFRSTDAVQTTDGVETSYQVKLETSYGDAEADLRVSSETTIPEFERFKVRVNAQTHLQYLGIPILLERRFGKGKFQFSVKGGFINNFLVKNDLAIVKTRVIHQELKLRGIDINTERQLQFMQNYTLEGQISLGLHYNILDNLSISLEPTYRKNLTPVFENNRFKTRTYTLAGLVGLRYEF